MDMKTNIFIHVGLHKTGTTYLQKEIFCKIKDINYLASVQLWKLHIEKDKINLISNELLSSDEPHFYKFGATNKYEILDHLKRLFPDAKIILGRREFNRWLKSCYKQYIVCGGTLKFNDYCEKYKDNFMDMDKYEEKIRQTFKYVCVYTQEELLNERKKTVEKICSFIGVDTPEISYRKRNVSPKDLHLKARRIFNRFYNSEFNKTNPVSDLIASTLLFFWSKMMKYEFNDNKKKNLDDEKTRNKNYANG